MLPEELRAEEKNKSMAPITMNSEGGIFLNNEGDPLSMAEMPPSNSMILSTDGKPIDGNMDIQNKSIE